MPYYFKETGVWGVTDELAAIVKGTEANWQDRLEFYETTTPEYEPYFQTAVEVKPEMVDGVLTQKWKILEADWPEIVKHLTQRVQDRLDNWAKTKGYTDIVTLCTYATSKVEKFSLEGQSGVDMRDNTWSAFYKYMEAIDTKRAYRPGAWVEVQGKLPELVWLEQPSKVKDQENV